MRAEDVVGDICGFAIVVIAVILLNAFQNAEISISDLRQMMRPKREQIPQKLTPFEDVLIRQNSRGENYRHGYGTAATDNTSANDLTRQL